MNKLEELHLDGITQAEYSPEDKVPNYVGFAKESAKITEQIAIEFAQWMYDYKGDINKVEELFQEFLKTKQ